MTWTSAAKESVMATVAVVGGGYGGAAVAKALDDVADVVLIEPREAFVHNVAALRSVVDPDNWVDAIFLPYDGLLARGRVLRDRAVRVFATGADVESGRTIAADYVVLATGSTVLFPAKIDVEDSAGAKDKIRATHKALADAPRVLLIGAGPVGLELAGEIKAVWPRKAVTIIERTQNLASGQFPDEFHAELRAQLDELGVKLLLGRSLRELPSPAPGEPETFTVTTHSGDQITADIWFACYGATVNTDYLSGQLATLRQPDNRIAVTAELFLPGHDTIFAVGDVTAVPEMKMARLAGLHADVVAANIRAGIEGRADLVRYQPAADAIMLPLGPRGGVSYAAEFGVLNAKATAELKSGSLFLDLYRDLLGVETAVTQPADHLHGI